MNKMNTTRVLALLPLLVVLAHSFSWDIVVGTGKRLKFYNNGTLTHTENVPVSKEIESVTYDPVHFRVLFLAYHKSNLSITSFDITTRQTQNLVMRITSAPFRHLAYDPVTQLVFWTEDEEIYSTSLNPASSNKTADGNLLVTTDEYCVDIAVDSCGGYIYWATHAKIEKAAFDGSEREVVIDIIIAYSMQSLAIDQQTKKMYWTQALGNQHYIESADLNGKNRRTIYVTEEETSATGLTVSKDFIYWRSYDQIAILQLPKHQQHGVAPIVYSDSTQLSWTNQLMAANYTIKEQTLGTKSCEALKSLLRNSVVKHSSDVCLNGSTCHNYCLRGNCSISAEGRPKCSCEASYTGERCEVNACYMYCLHGGVCFLNEEDEPVCQCTADYEGDRCDVVTSFSGVCVCADKTTQQILQEVKQVREDLQCNATQQLYLDKLD